MMATRETEHGPGTDQSMDGRSSSTRSRPPGPRWLVVAALALVLWASGLLVWWSRLQQVAGPVAPPVTQPTARPPLAVATPAPSATASPLVLTPLERTAGPLVKAADWESLANEFRADRAWADIAELAGARYAGRATGSPGAKLAAEWIASGLARYGLLPAGDGGTYFQEFPVPYAELTGEPVLDLLGAGGEVVRAFKLRFDYAPWPGGYADGGQAEAPVLWMGDGSAAEYRLLEAEGSIVLCRWQAPIGNLQRQALEHGARALLVYRPDYDLWMRRTAREEAILPAGIPTLVVDDAVMGALLQNSGLALADLPLEHLPRALPWRMRLQLPLEYDSQAVGRNVLAVLPGSDPDGLYQTVIVGAHYDHLGADPDGTLWGGANDDASGVAVLLELARVWQEQGYVPRRTVLFAAWDAEEIGLNGSKYYVEHPRLPLTSTVGMLQLDMVGAGKPTLLIEPHGLVADQSLLSAAHLGIQTMETSGGGSDHVPFAAVRVPATLYIWDFQSPPPLPYHVPSDNAALIDPARLSDAGRLAGLVLTTLASDGEDLEDLGAALQSALDKSDEQAFLSLVAAGSTQWRTQIAGWFATLRANQAVSLTLRSEAPLVVGDVATSTITLQYRWPDSDALSSAQFTARWARESGGWKVAGPAFATASTGTVVVTSLGVTNADALAAVADSLRQRVQQELGPVLPEPLKISLYGNAAVLRALERPPPLPAARYAWVDGERLVLGQTSALTATLLNLALTRTGWSPEQASWLSIALAARWSSDALALEQLPDRYVPVLLQAERDSALWPSGEMPLAAAVPSSRQGIWDAQAWAMLQYLASNGLLTRANADLGGWRQTVLQPWLEAQQGISLTLATRTSAVMALDESAFLATVNSTDVTLLQEERHWFADLRQHPVAAFSLAGQLLSLDGDIARARLQMRYQLAADGAQPTSVIWIARFVNRQGVWLYSDLDFTATASGHFVLKHRASVSDQEAQSLLVLAEKSYDSVATDLGIEPPLPVQLKLYDDPAVFRSSIYLSMGQARGWNEPGESIKLTNLATTESGPIIAHELTHLLLFQMGVDHAGVHEGTSQLEAALAFPRWKYTRLRRWRQTVYDTVRSGRPVGLASLANWSDWTNESELIYNIGWDSTDYLRRRFGREAFLAWLRCQASESDWSRCFSSTLHISYAAFDQQWRQAVLEGHIPPGLVAIARSFDGAFSKNHVTKLAQADWSGRETATQGNRAAVDYVAAAFAAASLTPLGEASSLAQPFTVNVSRLAAAPTLSYSAPGEVAGSNQAVTLAHLVDFGEVIGGAAGGGTVSAGLVYAPSIPSGVSFGGRVLLVDAGTDLQQLARQARSQGAVALLVKTRLSASDMATRSAVTQQPDPGAIPVLQLAEQAAQALLKAAGQPTAQAGQPSAAYALPISVTLDLSLDTLANTQTANVVGLLPGSDPSVANEFIVIGAQLDGVGSPPGGPPYLSANHDASGVAVLLEIARLWHDSGYRPRRSVVFAAWNAGEQGQLGSRHWLQSGAVKPEQIRAVLHLDGVGQGRGYYLDVAGDDSADAILLASLENAARQVEGRLNMLKYQAHGDDASFHSRGIPTVALSWEKADYANTPQDTPDLIDEAKLQATGRLVALTLMTLADE